MRVVNMLTKSIGAFKGARSLWHFPYKYATSMQNRKRKIK